MNSPANSSGMSPQAASRSNSTSVTTSRMRRRPTAILNHARRPARRSSSSEENAMRVEQLTCVIGAELVGVNLADAIDDDGLFAEIRAALLKHRVLFLRDQDISRAEHVAFARRFGELEDHPVAGSDPEHPGLVRIYKNPDQPNDRYENAWHADATWRDAPQFGAVLRCVECPPVGGDTMWANMVLAYEPCRTTSRPRSQTCALATASRRASVPRCRSKNVSLSRRNSRTRNIRSCARTRRPVRRCCS